MCGLLQVTSPNVKKSAVTASMMRVILLRDGSDNWSNHVERSLIVAMPIRRSYVYQRITEKCSDRKHRQHEADLLSKGHLWKGERRYHETNMSWRAKHVKTRSRGESQQIL